MKPTGTVSARALALCPLVAALPLLVMACSSEPASRAREHHSPAGSSAETERGPTANRSEPTPAPQGSGGGGPSPPASEREPSEQLPGAPPLGPEVTEKLQTAWASRRPQYKPRTHHLWPDGSPQYTNRLFLETSPYLLQHAHNPVNWYPWGDEAFETAKTLGRPVLLSVGYSTCHWCHVMEEESFEDVEIARAMNESYIAIKVDREERPDVDAIYMNAVQMMTGRGGWPMTVWLTPDRKPYFGGTYFPARDGDRGARMGFLTLLRRLRQAYDEEPRKVAESGSQISEAIRKNLAPDRGSDSLPGPRLLHDAFRTYRERFDPENGGLAGAPKFPSSLPVRLLLRYHRRTGDEESLRMAALTLEKMAAGGMHDHVGGGFHRYSTDERWLVPHFEKMLYDNALLAVAYLEGYQAAGREDFARAARDILDYVGREMTAPEGGFVAPASTGDAEPLLTRLRSAFVPNRILTVAVEGPSLKRHAELVPLVEGKVTRDGKATAYVCEVGVCKLPTTDPEVFAEQIRKVNRLDGN